MFSQELDHHKLHLVDHEQTEETDHPQHQLDACRVENLNEHSFRKLGKPKLSIFDLNEVCSVDAASLTFLGYHVYQHVQGEEQRLSFHNRIDALVSVEVNRSTLQSIKQSPIEISLDIHNIVNQSQISMIFSKDDTNYLADNDRNFCETNAAETETLSLTHLSQLLGEALRQKSEYHLIIYRTDLLPGTTEDTLIPILEASSQKRCGEDFGVCVVPSFLSTSASIRDYCASSQTIIGGNDDQATTIAGNFYKAHLSSNIERTSLRTSESIKFIQNSQRAMQQTFQNEIDRVCRAANVDIEQAQRLANMRSGSPLVSGAESIFDYGCTELERDLNNIRLLAKQHDLDLPLTENLTNSYDAHIDDAVETIRRYGQRKIGILGVTDMPKGNKSRTSLFELTTRLETLGYEVQVYDAIAQDANKFSANPTNRSLSAEKDVYHTTRCDSLEEFICYNDIVVQTSSDAAFVSCEKLARRQSIVISLVSQQLEN